MKENTDELNTKFKFTYQILLVNEKKMTSQGSIYNQEFILF